MSDQASYNPRRWAAFVVIMSATLMDLIDTTVITVALPSLRDDLDASSAQLEWSLAGYTLAFASGMVTASRLGDRYGRRRVFQLGLAAFVVTSAVAGLSTGPEMLIAARVAQGAAAALMVPQVLAMLRAEFPPEEQSRATTIYGLVFATGGVAGPLVGGFLLDANLFDLGWRPIFFVNVPIGIAAMIGVALLSRESRAEHADSADAGGLVLVTLALLALLYPLIEGRVLGWPWWIFVILAACPLLLWLLVRYENGVVRQGRAPLVDPRLLRLRAAVGGLSASILFFAGAAYTLVLTVHLQSAAGFSPLEAAVALVPAAVGVGLFTPLATRTRPIGRPLAVAGSLVMAAGMSLVLGGILVFDDDLSTWHLAPGLLIAGLGMSMTSGILVSTVMAKTPPHHAGAAAGLVSTAIQIGVAAGIAIVGTVYFELVERGHGETTSVVGGLGTVIVLYLLAAPAALILPGGRLDFAPAPDADEKAAATAADR
ncbi:MFS transporter [Thermomonospora umbrina]|uniref:EmrB/QacA subfamily drug resistance transporter n=1 Tax=Thermomonospora umbrina TaxID=111806 RepID=A0A3D9STF5_9ACTN|nr:MFS transporter [Thermomonospora umbrina]REE96255.1 EmrB/QacA subfamily drug resistance transporter [Thermomonospora umbrina]